jgi:alpha-soluble NSF attachment protein
MADAQLRLAQKTLSGARSSWFGKQDKLLEAAEEFDKAGNLLKANGQLPQAVDAYQKAYDIYVELKDNLAAGRSLTEVVNIHRQTDPPRSIDDMLKLQKLYEIEGNFRRINTLWESMAAQYEALGDLGKAAEAYESAAKGLTLENQVVTATKSWERFAELTAMLGAKPEDYITARDTFFKLGRTNIQNRTLRFGVKNLLFKAGRKCFISRIIRTQTDSI